MSSLALEAPLRRGLRLDNSQRASRSELAVAAISRTQQGVLLCGAAALPLVIDMTASDSYVLPKLLVARMLLVVLFALLLIRAALEGRLSWRRTPLDIPLVALLISAGLSTVFAVNRNLAIFGAYDRYEGLLTIALYALLFWMTVQTLAAQQQGDRLVTALILGGYVAALLAIGTSLLNTARGVGTAETAFTFAGVARASGTLGNPSLFAALLAMLLPLALRRCLVARSWWVRLGWGNVVVVMTTAIVLSFSRAGILAALAACGIVVASSLHGWRIPWRMVIAVISASVVLVALLAFLRAGVPLGPSIASRIASIAEPLSGSNATRVHVWSDALRMAANRPLVGFGPDTFGLVYPHFETGDWTPGYRIDKAHADALQVLVTQGAIGLAAYLALLGANLLMFWKARRIAAMPSLFAGFVGYELVTQVNFSWLPAALPFWIFLGAAFVMARGDERGPAVVPLKPLAWRSAVGLTSVLSLALLVPLVLQPYRGEGLFSSGLQAEVRGETATALSRFDGARRVSPENATYYAAEGNLLLMNGRFRESRNLLAGAVALGSEDASAQRSLQIIEELSRGAGN